MPKPKKKEKKEAKKTEKEKTKKVAKEKKSPKEKKVSAKKTPAKKKIVIEEKIIGAPEEGETEVEKVSLSKTSKYWEAVGRRKTSIARVRLFTKGEKGFLINGKDYKTYFPSLELQQIVTSAFIKMKCFDRFGVSVKVKGGGFHSQAEAIRHGTARALVKFNADFQKRLRRGGYLTRDSRMKERKKFGLKRARRAPQWQKR